MDPWYILVAGSRSFMNYSLIEHEINHVLSVYIKDQNVPITIVSGGARGVDTLAERYADTHGYVKKIFPAEWERFGKSAGFIRNKQMHEFLSQFQHRLCICFWNPESGRGTAHNFKLSQDRSTPLFVFDLQKNRWLKSTEISYMEKGDGNT